MRYSAIALAAAASILVGCNQGAPTSVSDDSHPEFAQSQNVSISGKGSARITVFESMVDTYATFQCPAGETALIQVTVTQQHSNGTTTSGIGSSEEGCRDGPNTVMVSVGALFCTGSPCLWDIGRAEAVFQVFTATGFDEDPKDILISAR